MYIQCNRHRIKQDSQSSTTYSILKIVKGIKIQKLQKFQAVCQDHRNGLQTYFRKHLQVIINLMNDVLGPHIHQARQMEEFEMMMSVSQ